MPETADDDNIYADTVKPTSVLAVIGIRNRSVTAGDDPGSSQVALLQSVRAGDAPMADWSIDLLALEPRTDPGLRVML